MRLNPFNGAAVWYFVYWFNGRFLLEITARAGASSSRSKEITAVP